MSDLSDLISLKFDGIITKVEKLANSNINLIEKNEKLQTIIDNLEKQNELLKKSNDFYRVTHPDDLMCIDEETLCENPLTVTKGAFSRQIQRQLAPLEAELKELK